MTKWEKYEEIWDVIKNRLGECKYKIKKIQMSRFINTELDSDSELMTKLKSDSDNGTVH